MAFTQNLRAGLLFFDCLERGNPNHARAGTPYTEGSGSFRKISDRDPEHSCLGGRRAEREMKHEGVWIPGVKTAGPPFKPRGEDRRHSLSSESNLMRLAGGYRYPG